MLSKHSIFFNQDDHSIEKNTQVSSEFLMGAGGAAYQIEGAWAEDGKGPSIWDTFTAENGLEDGKIACDEYHRFDETLDLLKKLNVNSYRFSIAWTRIQPTGEGEPNQKGLEYYRTILDKLKEANIIPIVTIYHWDLPQALEANGGWVNRDTVDKYLDYANILFKEFGTLVGYWITHNEPRVVSTRGYGSSGMAPGLNKPELIPIVNHHLLLSHGKAVQAFKALKEENYDITGQIGITLNLKPIYCDDDSRKEEKRIANRDKNHQYLSPILVGEYLDLTDTDFVEQGDMDIIKTPIDFLGINNYSIEVIYKPELDDLPVNSLKWKVYAEGLYDLLIELKTTYASALPPIFITENGYADRCTQHNLEEYLEDDKRAQYIADYLEAMLRAMKEGVHVIGYCYWSLLDNLEWSFGYKERFGLVHVNYETLERTEKASFTAYQKLIPQIKEAAHNLKEEVVSEQKTFISL